MTTTVFSEEPCDAKVSSTVLESSGGGYTFTDFNRCGKIILPNSLLLWQNPKSGRIMLPHKLLQVHNDSLQPLKQTELSHTAKSLAYPSTGRLGFHWDTDLPYRVERQFAATDGNKRLGSLRTIVAWVLADCPDFEAFLFLQ